MVKDRVEDVVNRSLNGVVEPALRSRLGWVLRPFITTITYTGRRSGRTFSTPVLYWRRGDRVTIGVAAPDSKQWWRNFRDGGGPITLDLRGGSRQGHAIATRDAKGRVVVRVELTPGLSRAEHGSMGIYRRTPVRFIDPVVTSIRSST